MSSTYINSPISLTSVADIRYRGILTKIDHEEATIGLSSVYSMGTENRRSPEEFIPPQERPYDYIVFRASEVQNLALDLDPRPEPRVIVNDPAVIGMQAAPNHVQVQPVPQPQAPRPYNQVAAVPVAPANPVPLPSKPVPSSAPRPPASGPSTSRIVPRDPVVNVPSRAKVERSETPPVRSASASMETVERAIGDLRISANSNAAAVTMNGGGARGHHRRGGRGRGPQQGGVNGGRAVPPPVSVPKEDFDFERANSKFDKASLFPSASSTLGTSEVGRESPEPGQIIEEKKESTKFYDKSRSFFDDISSDSKGVSPEDTDAAGGGRGRGGYGGRGRGRSRREDERNKNLSTFGETGMNLGAGTYWPGGGSGGGGGSGSGFRGRRRRPYIGNGQPRQSQQQ